MMSLKEHASEAAKLAPPGAVVGLDLSGISLNDVVLYATLLYTMAQFGFFLYDRYNLYKAKKNGST